MKKGEKRIGDYNVKLHSDQECYMCGQTLKAKTIQTRIYLKDGGSFYFCYDPNEFCMKSMMQD